MVFFPNLLTEVIIENRHDSIQFIECWEERFVIKDLVRKITKFFAIGNMLGPDWIKNPCEVHVNRFESCGKLID